MQICKSLTMMLFIGLLLGSMAKASDASKLAKSSHMSMKTTQAQGFFTAVAGGWTVHESAGMKPEYCSLSLDFNAQNGHGFIDFQIANKYETQKKFSPTGPDGPYYYDSTIIGDSATQSFPDIDGLALPPNANLKAGPIAWRDALPNRKSKATFIPSPTDPSMGTLVLSKQEPIYRVFPGPVQVVEHVDNVTMEIETSIDLEKINKVYLHVERIKPSLLNLAKHEVSDVTKWTNPQVLTDVFCFDFNPHRHAAKEH